MSKVKRYLILADLHYPFYDLPAWKAVLSYAKENRVDGVVLLGDFLDNQNVSHHTKDKPRLRKRGGYKEDLDGFVKDILDPLEERLPRGCLKVMLFGNHERFLEDLLDEQPELEGAIGIAENLHAKERGWKVIPVGGHYKLNNVVLMHGDQVGSGMNVAQKMVNETCRISLMGHVHRFSGFTKIGVEARDKWVGITLPCLSTLAPEYAKGKHNAFIHGFGIVESWGKHKVNIYVPIITKGQFSFNGRIYGR
jgi:Icc-related predicted phosphoesterase